MKRIYIALISILLVVVYPNFSFPQTYQSIYNNDSVEIKETYTSLIVCPQRPVDLRIEVRNELKDTICLFPDMHKVTGYGQVYFELGGLFAASLELMIKMNTLPPGAVATFNSSLTMEDLAKGGTDSLFRPLLSFAFVPNVRDLFTSEFSKEDMETVIHSNNSIEANSFAISEYIVQFDCSMLHMLCDSHCK